MFTMLTISASSKNKPKGARGRGRISAPFPRRTATKTQIGGSHYKDFVIQPAEFIHKNGIGFLEGNVIKYVCRHQAKNGKEDLLKARHYIDLLLELEYGE